jgi:hypothetical protein
MFQRKVTQGRGRSQRCDEMCPVSVLLEVDRSVEDEVMTVPS